MTRRRGIPATRPPGRGLDSALLLEEALQLIEHCDTGEALQEVIGGFIACVRRLGFSGCVAGAWVGVGRHRTYRFFFNDWPADWTEIYTQRNIFPDDPFVQEARRQMALFLWTEMDRDRDTTPRSREIHRLTYDYGWREVVGVPLHGPNGYQGLVSLATREDITLSAQDRALLSALSLAIHHRCHGEADFGMRPEDAPKLTRREIECLQWAALGKTDWEIAQLLGVAESTAHYHIERAKKRLGVNSRIQAVTLLALRGII